MDNENSSKDNKSKKVELKDAEGDNESLSSTEKDNIITDKSKIPDESDDESESESDDDNEVSSMKDFKEWVIKWVRIDDAMREYAAKTKQLRTLKKPLEESIIKFLEKSGETMIDITGGKLRRNKSETTAPLKEEIIKSALIETLGDAQKVKEIMESMQKKRPKTVRVNLKRTTKRGKN